MYNSVKVNVGLIFIKPFQPKVARRMVKRGFTHGNSHIFLDVRNGKRIAK